MYSESVAQMSAFFINSHDQLTWRIPESIQKTSCNIAFTS